MFDTVFIFVHCSQLFIMSAYPLFSLVASLVYDVGLTDSFVAEITDALTLNLI